MGSDRVGAPALVDSYRPGAFTMATFEPRTAAARARLRRRVVDSRPNRRVALPHVIRRFRSPIAARVTLEQGRPVRVTTDRRGFSGGHVERCEGPWRSSGDWWQPWSSWNCDEWDVTLERRRVVSPLAGRATTGQWSLNGLVD